MLLLRNNDNHQEADMPDGTDLWIVRLAASTIQRRQVCQKTQSIVALCELLKRYRQSMIRLSTVTTTLKYLASETRIQLQKEKDLKLEIIDKIHNLKIEVSMTKKYDDSENE